MKGWIVAIAFAAFAGGAPADAAGLTTLFDPAAGDGFSPPAQTRPGVQLAQNRCRSDCRSRRGWCVSTCRDSQCRAICNDSYQACVSRCR